MSSLWWYFWWTVGKSCAFAVWSFTHDTQPHKNILKHAHSCSESDKILHQTHSDRLKPKDNKSLCLLSQPSPFSISFVTPSGITAGDCVWECVSVCVCGGGWSGWKRFDWKAVRGRKSSRDKESGRGIKLSEREIESDREQTDQREVTYR